MHPSLSSGVDFGNSPVHISHPRLRSGYPHRAVCAEVSTQLSTMCERGGQEPRESPTMTLTLNLHTPERSMRRGFSQRSDGRKVRGLCAEVPHHRVYMGDVPCDIRSSAVINQEERSNSAQQAPFPSHTLRTLRHAEASHPRVSPSLSPGPPLCAT